MPETCHVCTQPADDTNSAICLECDQRFHLRLRADSEGPECGTVWINEQFLSLEYACRHCLGSTREGSEPSIGKGH